MVAQERAALGELRREARERQFLLLVYRSIDRPARRVPVAPLAADRQGVRCHTTVGEPARQELLGAAVAAGDVDVADAGRVRRVEQLCGASEQRVGRPCRGQVPGAAEVDVRRPPDGSEPEAEARDAEARSSERPLGERHPTSARARRVAVQRAR